MGESEQLQIVLELIHDLSVGLCLFVHIRDVCLSDLSILWDTIRTLWLWGHISDGGRSSWHHIWMNSS